MPTRLCYCGLPVVSGYRCAEHQLPKRLGGNQKRKRDGQVIARDGNRCAWIEPAGSRCPASTALHVDHVVPRTAGGTNDMSNLTTLCAEHHAVKTGRQR